MVNAHTPLTEWQKDTLRLLVINTMKAKLRNDGWGSAREIGASNRQLHSLVAHDLAEVRGSDRSYEFRSTYCGESVAALLVFRKLHGRHALVEA